MKLLNSGHIKHLSALSLFILGFLVFFVVFPLNDALPGSTDGWAYISFFRSYNNAFLSLFTGEQVGQSFYPNNSVYMYGDPCALGAAFYLPFQWLGANVVWAWALMLTIVYALNGFTAYLFFRQYTRSAQLGLVAGLLFSTAGFLWGNVDSPNAFYFCTLFMSLYCSLLFFNSGKWKHLLWAVLFGGATLYFSSYIFVFQTLLLGILWTFSFAKLKQVDGIVAKLSAAVLLAVLLVVPYLYFIANPEGMLNMWNPVREYQVLRALSLDPSDMVRPVKGNLIYPVKQDHLADHAFFYPQHAAWTGLLLWCLTIGGLFLGKRQVWLWVVMFLVGFFIAIGPEMKIGGEYWPTPVSIFYDIFGLDMAIRNPVRFWFLCLIGMIGLAVLALKWLTDNVSWGKWVLPLVCVVYIIENVPFKMHHYHVKSYVQPDEAYINTLAANKGAVVLELPSSIYTYGIDFPVTLNEYQREHIYQYWQTIHRQNILNGSNAFIPPPRMKVLSLVDNLTKPDSLRTLIKDFQVDLIVFHKDLTLQQDDPTLESYLKADTTMAELEIETSRTVIFSTTDQE